MAATTTPTYWRTIELEDQPEPLGRPDGDTAENSTENVSDAAPAALNHRTALTREEAESAWSEAAVEVLSSVASTYHGIMVHTDLAAELVRRTDVGTRTNPTTWISGVLAKVSSADFSAGRPPLASLVVHKVHGTVGEAYDEVLRVTGKDPIADPMQREKHAASARMDCYRWAGATLPADGGNPALSPRYDMIVTRERKRAREEAQPDVCPTCFMTIPPTGECDNCA